MSGCLPYHTIIRTSDDRLVRSIACDPGCHGVNFGAKKGGGYYAYVTSKFANRLIVLDYDPNNDGDVNDAVIAGIVVLMQPTWPISADRPRIPSSCCAAHAQAAGTALRPKH